MPQLTRETTLSGISNGVGDDRRPHHLPRHPAVLGAVERRLAAEQQIVDEPGVVPQGATGLHKVDVTVI